LQGQSAHLANASLSYKTGRWDGRVSAMYTGRRIYSASGWYGLDYWQRAYAVVDASVGRELGHGWRVFVKADNLFNTSTTVDLLPAEKITVMRQEVRASYFAGVQWRGK